MCIALPMKVLESGPMMVVCERSGRRLEVDCSMIDQPAVGAWLLVFQNRALREIEEAEAGEIEAALGATARVMSCLSRSLISCRMPSIVTCWPFSISSL